MYKKVSPRPQEKKWNVNVRKEKHYNMFINELYRCLGLFFLTIGLKSG